MSIVKQILSIKMLLNLQIRKIRILKFLNQLSNYLSNLRHEIANYLSNSRPNPKKVVAYKKKTCRVVIFEEPENNGWNKWCRIECKECRQ